MSWVRLYTDILTDADVLSLECRHFRTWVLSLLSAKQNHRQPGFIPELKQWALDVKLRPDVAEQHLQVLINAGLIDRTERGYRHHNWDNWQYKSDDVNARVRDWRKRQRNVSCNVTCNSHVTHQSTDTDTDTDTENPPIPPASTTTNRRPINNPAPAAADDFDFPAWFEALYALAPKKGMKSQARAAMATDPRIIEKGFRDQVEFAWKLWAEYMAVEFHPKRLLLEWWNDEGWRDAIPKSQSKLDYQLDHMEA